MAPRHRWQARVLQRLPVKEGQPLDTSNIRRRSDLTVRDLGSEMILYDPRTESFHVLNSSARDIWMLLEERRASGAIEEGFASLYPAEDPVRLANDLLQTLEEFDRKGLLHR